MSCPRSAELVLASALLLAVAATPAAAQLHFNQRYGSASGFGDGAPDSVNPFNGHMSMRIPIGGSYPVGGAFSYGLTLAYHGNVWDYQEVCTSGTCKTQAIPSRRSNAGLGWTLSLGRLIPPTDPMNTSGKWMLLAADGGDHLFYPTLHAGETADTDVSYTRDGSYLRMKKLLDGAREVEFPNGEIHRFGTDNRIAQLRDRYGNYLNVGYPTATTWTLTDRHLRSHTITFQNDAALGQVVQSVALAAFNGGTATYNFTYAPTWIDRGCPHTDTSIGTRVQVPLLTGVTLTLPGGATHAYTAAATDYLAGDGVGCDSTSGYITALGLTTGGKVLWTWNSYAFPGTGFAGFDSSTGVETRSVKDANGAALGTWSYASQLVQDPDFKFRELKTTVTDPQLHKTVHYFSVDLEGGLSAEGWSKYDYGLPFTRKVSSGTGPVRYLSTERIDKNGTTQQRTFVRFERDKASGAGNNWDLNRRLVAYRTLYPTDGNRTADVAYSGFDGVGHYRTATLGGSFPAGNAGSTTTDFNTARGVYQIDPATDQPTAGHTYTKWPTGTIWVLGTYDAHTVVEGTSTAKTEYCFDFDNANQRGGFLQRKRILASSTGSRGGNDVLYRFTDLSGNLRTEERFGGDTQAVATNAHVCSVAFPATPQVVTTNTYQNGNLSTSQISGVSFKSVDQDIDPNTGLVKTSRDAAGLSTSYEYDLLGRITYVKPQSGHDGWSQYAHFAASGSVGPSVFIKRRNNGGSVVLAETALKFDGLGRLWREQILMPGGTWSIQETAYYPGGLVKSVSTLGDTANKTVFDTYDHFGRPLKITPPDGTAHQVTFTYQGVQTVTRRAKVGTGRDAVSGAILEVDSSTVTTYDRRGRIHQVFEPANVDGTNSTTTYFYDVASRVNKVTQTAKDTSLTPQPFTQTRLFTYDNRGFLLSEKHPEKGLSGNGTVTYSSYDSRGLPGRIQDGPNDLTFTYDKAGRATQVAETGGRVLKTFTYATANGTSNWKNGKLEVARRYNYVMIGATPYTVDVAETYTYGGRGGRVSKRDTTTSVNGATGGESFTQSWTWNELGDAASTTYPKCTHAGCTATTGRTISPTYTNGFLTAVAGYASPITYHPNGMVNQVTHLNTSSNSATWVTDTHYKDPFNAPRPDKIDAKLGTTVVWNSGVYAYDGSGNVTKNGNAYFLYDKASRVKSGLLYTGPGAGGSTVSFSNTYDGFGNITALSTATSRNIPIETSLNRLKLSGASEYDAAGNMTRWNAGPLYEYDRFNMMWHMKNGTEDWLYLYTASDERIWSYSIAGKPSRWTLRDLDGKVLREYENAAGVWKIQRDYVYRGSQLLAAHTTDPSPKDLVQFHLDHLGTPRAVTNRNGARIAYHLYYPYGEEATGVSQDAERMKFTGHERDLADPASAADDLDYMHARFYNPQIGRFLSFDPVGGVQRMPQSFNRYPYVLGNPLKYVDPYGLFGAFNYPRLPSFSEEITVTDKPYDYGGYAGFLYFSFFLQNIQFLATPPTTQTTTPLPSAPPPQWVNPTGNCPRKCDSLGCGNFRASRDGGTRTHDGADFLASAGQDVVAPTSGMISRPVNRVYKSDSRYTGFVLSGDNGHSITGFYVTLNTSLVGNQVTAGDLIGTAQDLNQKYPAISNHVHIEILGPAGHLVDPLLLIPVPAHCP